LNAAKLNPPRYGQLASATSDRLKDSAIGIALSRNLATAPQTSADWNAALPNDIETWQTIIGNHGGTATGLLIPFSSATGLTSLKEPRLVMTPSRESQLRGRLFIGYHQRQDGKRNLEFISWNRQRGAFDFGTITTLSDSQNQTINFVDNGSCYTCHRSRTPIFPSAPWDNSVANRATLVAFVNQLSAADPSTFGALDKSIEDAASKDTAARRTQPLNPDHLMDQVLSSNDIAKHSKFWGFNFVDPSLIQAFDFDDAIFAAQSLAFTHEWLQTLPDQDVAEQIAHQKQIDLAADFSDHFQTVQAYKNPRLKNFNIVAGIDNSDHRSDAIIPSASNIESISNYDQKLANNHSQSIPLEFRPTVDTAFAKEKSTWQELLSTSTLKKAFQENDLPFEKQWITNGRATTTHSCVTCHSGEKGSPQPHFGRIDPLLEESWHLLLKGEAQVGTTDPKILFCSVSARITSEIAPMPPVDSPESHVFNSTQKTNTVAMLESIQATYQLTCTH